MAPVTFAPAGAMTPSAEFLFFFVFFFIFQVEDEIDEINKKEFEKLENKVEAQEPPKT